MLLLCVLFQSLGTQEQERQTAIASLRSLEAEFVELMQAGIQRFSRPLRQYIISPSEHATLFQNVEKVGHLKKVTISEIKSVDI